MNENLTLGTAGHMTGSHDDLASKSAPPMSAPVILIVDDDDSIREVLWQLLNRETYTLIDAENGIAALAACQRQPVDLILLDIMMPLMDGLTACAKIRALPGYEHVPILMLTALKDTASITRAFEAGATDYLTKPIDSTVLRPRVKHLLRVTQAEARVRVSEQKFRGFVEQASDGFMLADEHGQIIEWNRSMEQITGYSRAEMLGRRIWDAQQQLTANDWKAREEYQRLLTAQHAAYQTGAADVLNQPIEIVFKHRDGSHRMVQQVVFPIVTEQGHYRLGSSTRDVTRQKQIEAALRDSEVRYRLITENMSDGVWLLDMQLNTTYISPAVLYALGYSVEVIKQRARYGRVLTTASRRTLFRFLKQALTPENLRRPADNLSQTLELELYRQDGSTLWSEVTLTLIRDEDGKPGGILAVGRDITERKRAAESVLRLTDDLSQRARELTALNNASRALTSSLELEQVLAAIMQEIQELLKADRAAVLLRDATSDDLVFAAAAGENSEKLIGTRMSITHGIAGWVARERQSALVQEAYRDPRFWVSTDARTGYLTRSVVAVPIKYRGAVWGVIEAINKHDGVFSERDREMLEALAGSAAIALENARLYQAEREQTHRLKESQAKLIHAEKMSALGRLAASLTHEINNPLQALHSGLGLIQAELSEDADPADVLRDLQIIDQEVKRISDLMLRLREFSRPVELETRPTDLRALFDTILSLTGKQMQRNHIQVKTTWDPTVPPIMASPDQLTQVFMNLVLNAIDAMPGGGLLTISTTADRSRADFPVIRIDVTDTGCGISPEALPRIFEPFFTTKQDGTGLGLAISFEIVKSLGGEITVASQPDAGTTFTVMLPLREF